jgi:hypothetical protein
MEVISSVSLQETFDKIPVTTLMYSTLCSETATRVRLLKGGVRGTEDGLSDFLKLLVSCHSLPGQFEHTVFDAVLHVKMTAIWRGYTCLIRTSVVS